VLVLGHSSDPAVNRDDFGCCSVSLELLCNTDHRKGDIQKHV